MITIDGIPIDVVEKEDHNLEVAITEHPVETGVDITDHMRPKPRTLTFTNAVVSNTPIGAIAKDATRTGTDDPAAAVFRFFEALYETPRVVTVVSKLKRYESMGLESLSVPVEHKDAGGLVFTVKFKRITFVTNNRVTVLLPNTAGATDLGPQGITTLDGKHILWRKGKPPGKPSRSFDSDEKADGVIVGQEVVTLVKGKLIHQDGKTQLSAEEEANLKLDLRRDEKFKQQAGNRAPKDQRQEALKAVDRNRTDTAMRILKGQDQHPGAKPDPAVLRPGRGQ